MSANPVLGKTAKSFNDSDLAEDQVL